jgi:SAM-dependent methyltransferase
MAFRENLQRARSGIRSLGDEIRRRPVGLQEEGGRERAKARWRQAAADRHLTWGIEATGDAFVEVVQRYYTFSPTTRVIEIGPGYGRLARAFTRLPHARYVGVDLSEQNVAYLRKEVPAIEVFHGDIEILELAERFDVMVSSLTLKHLYPDFGRALESAARHLDPDGWLFFDLIEARLLDRLARRTSYFQRAADATYIRRYTRHEVTAIVEGSGLTLVAFDEVRHDPQHTRLLVICRRS